MVPEIKKGPATNGAAPQQNLKQHKVNGKLQIHGFEESEDHFDTVDSENRNVFIPTWDNKPEDVKPTLSLGGVPFLTHQNTAMAIALPGNGKSSTCEAICTSFLNPEADCLGFQAAEDCRGVIYIDNERTNIDVWNSFHRMCKRAGIPHGTKIENVTIAGLRSVPRLEERLNTIVHLLENNPCSLLLIDGLGDLVNDSNDLMEAIACRIWLRETTVNYNLSIFTTIHPNPGSNKPRGHIGSEGHREAECVLLIKNVESEVKVITTDFEYGKNRNNSQITTAFKWCDSAKMFISVDADSISLDKGKITRTRQAKAELLAVKLLPPPTAKTNTQLVNSIIQSQGGSESTAKRILHDMLELGFVKKHDDGFYRSVI